jgi:hypothetical protein
MMLKDPKLACSTCKHQKLLSSMPCYCLGRLFHYILSSFPFHPTTTSRFPSNSTSTTLSMSQDLLTALEALAIDTTSDPMTDAPTADASMPKTNLVDILSLYPICDRFLTELDISDILSVRLLSRRLLPNITSYCQKRWDINRRLRRFVENPKEFRTELGNANAFISGSFAIQFFDNVLWEKSDLDIYLRDDGKGTKALTHHLVTKEGV